MKQKILYIKILLLKYKLMFFCWLITKLIHSTLFLRRLNRKEAINV